MQKNFTLNGSIASICFSLTLSSSGLSAQASSQNIIRHLVPSTIPVFPGKLPGESNNHVWSISLSDVIIYPNSPAAAITFIFPAVTVAHTFQQISDNRSEFIISQ